MVKNTKIQNVETLLAERNRIESRINQVTATLGRFANVSLLGIASADANTTFNNFLNIYGKGNEAQIPEGKKGGFRLLKEDADKKRDLYTGKKQEEEALRKELADLQAELERCGRYASSSNVLQLQADVTDIDDYIKELMKTIGREEEKVRLGNVGSHLLTDLCREREDLMAEVALGSSVDQSSIDQIAEQIAEEEARISEAMKAGEQASIIIAGLRRKVDEAERALARKRDALQVVYCDFLITEAEKAGTEFVELSKKLWEKFSRLMALGTMIEGHPSAQGKSVILGQCRAFKIPGFKLESCQTSLQDHGHLHSIHQLDITAAIAATKDDITALGISIPR
jgi:hypothetical protein